MRQMMSIDDQQHATLALNCRNGLHRHHGGEVHVPQPDAAVMALSTPVEGSSGSRCKSIPVRNVCATERKPQERWLVSPWNRSDLRWLIRPQAGPVRSHRRRCPRHPETPDVSRPP